MIAETRTGWEVPRVKGDGAFATAEPASFYRIGAGLPPPVATALHGFHPMKTTSVALVTGLALVLLGGCQTLANLNIQNPTYRIMSVQPRVDVAIPLSASRIDFDLSIGVENPNSISLNLDRMDFDLLVNGTRVVSGLTNQRIRIPADGTGTLDLTASVGYDEIQTLFREIVDAVQGNRPQYEVRGTAHYDTPVGPLSFPVTIYRAGR
jgi:LEA14-like dessication related protein